MIKPYYQDDYVTLYNGDCRDIISELNMAFDFVLTDPPYGMNYQSCRKVDWDRKDKIKNDKEFPLYIFEMKPDIALLVWCRWNNLKDIPMPKSLIVWDKGIHSMGDLSHEFGRRWEACAFYPGKFHKFKYRPVDIISIPRVSPDKLKHPNEKPIGAIKPLIDCHETTLILDPFAGSGTTGVAAKELNRKCVLIELEEKYCEITAKRLSQEVFNFEEVK